ncbi:MAG: lipoyl synthase [Chitinispirillaceae bacterium]|nr:lipoyl synthase [Chitinispirillaceae bacterium]
MKEIKIGKPNWLKRPKAFTGKQHEVVEELKSHLLNTVCKEAKCPNRGECFSKGRATFLVLGSICTRNCAFCGISKGIPLPPDEKEIENLTRAAIFLKLKHVVITSVTRDDLEDGGASFFAKVVKYLRERIENLSIELLIPDFRGNEKALSMVIESRPDVINHNIETVRSLYDVVRPMANYETSLRVIKKVSESGIITKSGFMVGLGEREEEIYEVLEDLYYNGCKIVTIGQYLQPSQAQVEVKRYLTPEEFKKYEKFGLALGFAEVMAGPYVRSSYNASQAMEKIKEKVII